MTFTCAVLAKVNPRPFFGHIFGLMSFSGNQIDWPFENSEVQAEHFLETCFLLFCDTGKLKKSFGPISCGILRFLLVDLFLS